MMFGFKGNNKSRISMDLKDVSARLDSLRMPTSLVFTPTNLETEKAKFFDSDTYNPSFEYRIVKNRNQEYLEELSRVDEVVGVDPRISAFYIDLIQSKIEANEMMYSVGDNEKLTKISINRFRMPTPVLFRNAARILRGYVRGYSLLDDARYARQEKLNYDEISEIFKIVFKEFGLGEWSTEKSINIEKNGVKVGIKQKEVLMDPNIAKRPIELRKTIVHEMTHVLRAHNGEFSGFPALAKATLPSYLDVEEGLAGYNEELMGVLKAGDLKVRAGKVWAIHLGVKMSFRDLYSAVLSFVPKNNAFKIAYRVKRGLGDTAMPGIYGRDVSYFRGFRRVRRKMSEDKKLYAKLYAGKLNFKQIEWVEDGLIPKAKIVPTKSDFDRIFREAGI